MKKILSLVLAFLLMSSMAMAEIDVSSMSLDELLALRLQINEELATRKTSQDVPDGATIAELFPDPVLAKCVRDEVGAFSVNDVVSQEKLDSIDTISSSNMDGDIKSIEGIGHLHGMWQLVIYDQDQLKSIPDEIENCVALTRIFLDCKNITSIPDSICNLPILKCLDISDTPISELPADIGNLTTLKELNISHTNITSLPESIYKLELDKFQREGLDL